MDDNQPVPSPTAQSSNGKLLTVLLTLLLFPPLGIILMWVFMSEWPKKVKLITTLVYIGIILLIVVSNLFFAFMLIKSTDPFEKLKQKQALQNLSLSPTPSIVPTKYTQIDACDELQNTRFLPQSVVEKMKTYPAGVTPTDVPMFGWSVELTNGHYKWKYGSALFGGDYTCKNNILTVDNPAYPVTATYDPETKILLWNSTEYIQDTTPKEVTILATKPKTTTCSPIDEKTAINAVKNFHIIKDYYSNILHSEYLYTNAYRPTSNPNLYVYWEVKFGELRDDALDIKKIVYVSKCGEIVGEYIPPGLSEKQ